MPTPLRFLYCGGQDSTLVCRRKCGNFAVLVDLHVLPRGTSKDTSWFSVQEKEEVCVLLRDTIEWRVRQHAESHKQPPGPKHQEYTQSSPLFLKGNRLRVAAYFIKRWVKLRCVVKHVFRELHVFPDRFVVCASQLEADPNLQISNANKAVSRSEDCSSGTSRYFSERRGDDTSDILSSAPKKQAVLKSIVKKTESTTDSCCEAESRADGEVFPCPGRTDTRNKGEEDRPPAHVQSEAKCRSAAKPEHCINTTENNSTLPLPEVENHVNRPLPCETISQQNHQYAGSLKGPKRNGASSRSAESADSEDKQSLTTAVTQHKRRRHSSEGNKNKRKKAGLRDDTYVCLNGQRNYTLQRTNGDVEDVHFSPQSSFSNSSADTVVTTKITRANKFQERTLTDKILEQTGTGRALEQTGTGRPLEQTGTGRPLELQEQTGTGRPLELQEQTGTGRPLEQTGTSKPLELEEQAGTCRPLKQIGTGRPLEQVVTRELLDLNFVGKLTELNRARNILDQSANCNPPKQTNCRSERIQSRATSLASNINTGTKAVDNMKTTEFQPKKLKLQRTKKGQ